MIHGDDFDFKNHLPAAKAGGFLSTIEKATDFVFACLLASGREEAVSDGDGVISACRSELIQPDMANKKAMTIIDL